MTGHILRFAEHDDPTVRKSFDRLFGPVDYRTRIKSLTGPVREDELVRCYCDAVRETGGYSWVCPAVILHPNIDRTHFHLLYATRSPKGVEVFKQAEKQAMSLMEQARAAAQKRKREVQTRQMDLLAPDDLHDPQHYDSLRERHLTAARDQLAALFHGRKSVPYDHVWSTIASHPLVWESDLKSWIAQWVRAGKLQVSNLRDRERVPKRGEGHSLLISSGWTA